MSPPDSERIQGNMQGILDQFDPLTLKSNSESTQNPRLASEAPISEMNKSDTSSASSSPKKTNPSSENEKIRPGTNHSEGDDEELPFDFQRFLEQLRHKSADPIARYLKSFLAEFNRRNWTTDEQVKIIGDFKSFIAGKMDECPPFSTLSDAQMDNALEGMEKLIMNRLYSKTFSPEIPAAKRTDNHEEDVIRDQVLDDKMSIWHWVEGRHLDIPNRFLRNGEAFVNLASDQLGKINHFRAPRDKMICLLNCCKVIFGLLRQSNSEENADGFLPILIYVVIKAHPQHMISNFNYIQRFRTPDKLNGEAGYYLSSLQGAVSFIETLDRSSLSISDEEFNRNVDASVKTMSTKAQETLDSQGHNLKNPPLTPTQPSANTPDRTSSPKTANPMEGSIDPKLRRAGTPTQGRITPSGSLTPSAVLQNSAGLLAAPFKSLSKLFESEPASPVSTPSPTESQNIPLVYSATEATVISQDKGNPEDSKVVSKTSPEELAARQISAEEQEARRISDLEFESVVETLSQMFPLLDREVIVDVVTEKQGRVGAAVDTCLSLVEDS